MLILVGVELPLRVVVTILECCVTFSGVKLSIRSFVLLLLWLDFRMIDENALHGTGRRIENASEGITLQIEKKAESAGNLNAYIYLLMDAQLNIQNGAYVSALY